MSFEKDFSFLINFRLKVFNILQKILLNESIVIYILGFSHRVLAKNLRKFRKFQILKIISYF